MKYLFLPLLLLGLTYQNLWAQRVYTAANVHAHNDYVQPIPFFTAYYQQAGSIEADLYLQDGELYVAHEPQEIAPDRTLEVLYLKPLQAQIKKNQGRPYPPPNATLQFLIDLKTEGPATLALLVKKLTQYPEIKDNPAIKIVISGNRPAPEAWASYPAYIYFDGRPNETYTPAQLQRVGLISDSFRNYTNWNGKGILVKSDREKIQRVIQSVHQQNKKLRFWATPDNVTTWKTLMHLGVDYLGTDNVTGLTTFLKKLPTNE